MRVGARIICINDRGIPRTARIEGAPLVEGMTYTVRAVSSKTLTWAGGQSRSDLGIQLVENRIYHLEFNKEMCWNANRFREIEPPTAVEQVTHTAEPALV